METVLDKVIVNIAARRLTLLSSEGDVKVVDCETMQQFEDVLRVVREKCNDEVIYEY
jgi:cell division ATPase FtsA